MGAEFFPCAELESQTEMTKLIVAFGNFAKTPIKENFKLPLFVMLFWAHTNFVYLFCTLTLL